MAIMLEISAASGYYISFLDDDDEWLPYKTEKQIQVFRKNPDVGLVYSGQNCIFKDLGIQYRTKPLWEGDLSKRIFIHSDPGTTSQVMVKKELLDRVGLFDEKLEALQDYDLWIRCCQVTKVGYVYEPCINYYNSYEAKQISSNNDKYIRSIYRILDKYKDILDEFDPDFRRKVYSNKMINAAVRFLRNGNRKMSRRYTISAWRILPSLKCIELYIASFFPYRLVLFVRGVLMN